MSKAIDYYFTCISPFAYLGHRKLMEIAKKHGKTINFKPFNLFAVWENSGAVMPSERPLVRQRYRNIELQRVAAFRDTCLNPKPEFFPTNPALGDQVICLLAKEGKDPAPFSFEVGRAVWERNLQVADEAVLTSLLKDCGLDGDDILPRANSDAFSSIREQNSRDAVHADAVGAPAYVYNGEVFWGQDRLEYLEEMVSSDRRTFSADI